MKMKSQSKISNFLQKLSCCIFRVEFTAISKPNFKRARQPSRIRDISQLSYLTGDGPAKICSASSSESTFRISSQRRSAARFSKKGNKQPILSELEVAFEQRGAIA